MIGPAALRARNCVESEIRCLGLFCTIMFAEVVLTLHHCTHKQIRQLYEIEFSIFGLVFTVLLKSEM